MRFAAKHKLPTCPFGFCCSFSASIPNDARCTLPKPPRAPPLHSQADSSKDEDYEFINHDSANKRNRYSLKKHIDHPDNVNFLHKYFESTQPPSSMSPPNVEELIKIMNKSRYRSKRSLLKLNQVQGALIYPEFNLLIQPDATNIHWSCDHLALAESTRDSTPAILHAVISAVNAMDVEKFFDVNAVSITRLKERAERIVLRVKSPEDVTKEVDFNIDLFIVEQVRKIDSNNPLKGQTYFDPSYLADFQFFGHEDIRLDVSCCKVC
jgi:hypothetical protein